MKAYKVEATVPEAREYYSKIVTWVAADSFLPLQRDYYDPRGLLWKTELFESVSEINGVPTPLLIRMKDVEQDQNTNLALSMVEYDLEIPDSIFDPNMLPQVANHECWGMYCPVTVPEK